MMSNIITKKSVKPYKHCTSYYRNVKKQTKLTKKKIGDFSVIRSQSLQVQDNNYVLQIEAQEPSILISSDTSSNTSSDFQILVEDSSEANLFEVECPEDGNHTYDEREANEYVEKNISFMEELRSWALVNRVSHTATTELLKLLIQCPGMCYLPRSSKTLLKTLTYVNIIPMDTGEYWHNGLRNCLMNSFSELDKSISITLSFNMDGLPITNSSKAEFWPIICIVQNEPYIQPMTIGIYYGHSKPNVQNYLKMFVEELGSILDNGVFINNHRIAVKIRCFLCDTPARAFIKGTVNSNAYHGCTRCTVIGEYYKQGHHMSYPRYNMPLRTDASFRTKSDSEHHKEDSPLLDLPIDMIEDFPVADSLHLFDLGIMKRCLKGWVSGSFNFRTKLSAREINEISKLLQDCNGRKPSEIHRAIRRLDCLSFWKGAEFRTFLLYVGPVVLKDYLEVDVYHHFLLLNCAVTICSCKAYLQFLNIAEVLLTEYVEKYIDIYGIDSISSNVHNLCHVIKDVEKFGHLPSFSAYPFENHLGQIKNLVRSGNRPLAQIAKRINELSKMKCSLSTEQSKIPFVKMELPSPNPNFTKVYLFIQLANGFVLRKNKRDKWFMTKDNEIVGMEFATHYDSQLHIYGASLKRKTDFFDRPFKSSRLNIYLSDSETEVNSAKLYALFDVKCKLMCLQYNNKYVFMPLIHTLDL